jgi:hypothetical protein
LWFRRCQLCPSTVMERQFYPSATFRGLRHVPFLVLLRNSLYPALGMNDTAITIRVIRDHTFPASDIATVDVRWRLAHQVTLVPRKGPWTFSANFLDKVAATSLVKALEARGVPITMDARRFLKGAAP